MHAPERNARLSPCIFSVTFSDTATSLLLLSFLLLAPAVRRLTFNSPFLLWKSQSNRFSHRILALLVLFKIPFVLIFFIVSYEKLSQDPSNHFPSFFFIPLSSVEQKLFPISFSPIRSLSIKSRFQEKASEIFFLWRHPSYFQTFPLFIAPVSALAVHEFFSSSSPLSVPLLFCTSSFFFLLTERTRFSSSCCCSSSPPPPPSPALPESFSF